ncbi:amidase [Bosea sp. BK604]|uniref:amidase n=1 Tax=Bosea sp. BK604 TaxID=2512180 RepID=UPI001046B7D0|nr:amidase [Bosea sp. BK604]TCR64255.1 Asp-tRNA(Asn)/Glu-tRNA(Gln) amidotransferase A subunit family amidase [Bosea sp. BK604]
MLRAREIARRAAVGQDAAAAELKRSAELISAKDGDVRAFASRPAMLAPGTGPLAGIACGVKDIIDTAGLPTGMGSPIYDGWQPRADAPIVMALKAAGATVAGKTQTTAFAFLDPAPTRNPHELDASPGGSSAGSAAAVAAGMIPLALGTQTGGSVIRPAAYCGVAAIKPSYALLPTVGVKPFSWSLDTVGLMAASADDLGFALAALTGRSDLDASPAELKGLRIGISRQDFAGASDPASDAALKRVADLAASAGAKLVDLASPAALAEAFQAHGPLQDFEAVQALAWEYAEHRASLPPKLRAYLESARATTPRQYDEARRLSRRGRDACRDVFAEVDVVISHAAPGEAPATLASTGDSKFNRLWTLLGTPCATIPLMRGPRGLPVSFQIIGRFGHDDHVIAVAKALEKLVGSIG